MKPPDIAEVAKRSGVPASTLRYYEEKGLIESIGRRGARRVFGPGVFQQLALIALGQAGGFSLDEISGMFSQDGRPQMERAKIEARAIELEQTIRRLRATRDALLHVAACPAPSHLECPTFARMLKVAASGRLNGGKRQSSRAGAVRKKRDSRKRPAW